MMNLNLQLFLSWILIILTSAQNFTGTDKHGVNFSESTCNKDTIIDFSFSSTSKLTCNISCSITQVSSFFFRLQAQSSSFTFLNVLGIELELILQSVQVNNETFRFNFQKEKESVQVYVNYQNNLTDKTEINLIRTQQLGNNFASLKDVVSLNDFSLSVFNFLNLRDFGQFYHSYNDVSQKTILKNYWIYQINIANLSQNFNSTDPTNLMKYGDFLCYGSQSQGIVLIGIIQFQTHLRESYPLWTIWFGILIYWSVYLLTSASSINCYDKQFENDKMTCWSLYSLFYLSNEEFFTKLSRITLILINISVQAVILAAIISTIGNKFDAVIIAWTPFVALGCTIPVPFLLGCVFLSNIYKYQLHKYEVLKRMKGLFNKDSAQAYQTELQNTQQTLYGLYYWYYVFAFILVVVCWVVSIHLMMQTQRSFYFLHRYWLASLGATFILEHFLLQPILALIFGNLSCYRKKGYFYDFKLGQQYKQIQQ